MHDLKAFMRSRDFGSVAAFGDEEMGFIWAADLSDAEALERVQTRWLQIEEASEKMRDLEALGKIPAKERVEKLVEISMVFRRTALE